MAIHRYRSLTAEVFWPPVMTLANPRPASIMTSVVMNGWRPTTAIRMPLIEPSTAQSASASPMAANAAPIEFGALALLRNSIATAPETAIIEPTDRSMPPVAITRHMPVAIINRGAEARAMSTRLPTNAPVFEL